MEIPFQDGELPRRMEITKDASPKRGRGRPPKTDAEAKRYSTAISTTHEMKEKIRAAAEASGRNMTQEIEARLERSIWMDELGQGTRETALLVQAIQAIVNMIELQTGRRWHEDPMTYLAMRSAVEALVKENRPRVMPDGYEAEIMPLWTRYHEASDALEQAKGRLEAFYTDHPELRPASPFPPALTVGRGPGLFGGLGLVPAAQPPEPDPETAADRDRLLAEVDEAQAALDAIRAELDAKTAPYDTAREEHGTLGLQVAAAVAPRFRIIRQKKG